VYKVLKAFKCRHQKFKVFKEGNEYKSVNKEHTEKLLKEGYIKEQPKKVTKKKNTTKKKDDKK